MIGEGFGNSLMVISEGTLYKFYPSQMFPITRRVLIKQDNSSTNTGNRECYTENYLALQLINFVLHFVSL